MMDRYNIFASGRGGGKTTQMMRWIDEALSRGEMVAVITHSRDEQGRLAKLFLDSDVEFHCITERSSLDDRGRLVDRPFADLFVERSMHLARGYRYDHAYVDNANLFEDDPTELVRQSLPGVPATFTYTPYPFEP